MISEYDLIDAYCLACRPSCITITKQCNTYMQTYIHILGWQHHVSTCRFQPELHTSLQEHVLPAVEKLLVSTECKYWKKENWEID